MATGQQDWLNLTTEVPLEPDMPILDAHQHFWAADSHRGQYLVEDFLRDSGGGHKVLKTVFIECGSAYRQEGPLELRPVGETEFTVKITDKPAKKSYGQLQLASALVSFADLMLGEKVRPVLEEHIAEGKGRLKGIRQNCNWDANPKFISFAKDNMMMADNKFREGFACLQKYGLSFDAWQYFTQLEQLADLASVYPGISIIVNHSGGVLGVEQYAGRSREVFEKWKKGIKKLASLNNVFLKLGGMGMPRCGFGWDELPEPPGSVEIAAKLSPYFDFCIEAFGPVRCMFESNYPVDRASYSYTVLWNAFKLMTQKYSRSERNNMFYGTAARAYRIEN